MKKRPKLIIVPVDGSEGAGRAAALAAGLAEALQVPIQLLFVFPTPAATAPGLPGGSLSPMERLYYKPGALEKLREEASTKAFQSAREAMGDVAGKVEEIEETGVPADVIIDHANSVPDAMIVIGRRGLSRFKEILLGSVSQRVIDRATCPVTVSH